MIESFVDLTYRGLSLGRRIRLSQVRPRSGYLELPAPMPVGTELAITTDDGTAFDATVTSIREQVGGAEHAPGMTVAPALTNDAVAAWWAARVSLPEDAARPRTVIGGRNRPVTVRPRSHAERATDPPPLERARTDEVPTIAGDVDERIAATAAAEVGAEAHGGRVYGDGVEVRTILTPMIELPAEAPEGDDGSGPGEGPGDGIEPNPGRTLEVPAMAPMMAPPMRRTGEHEVVDDGNRTVLMESVDPATLGLDMAGAGASTGGGEPLDDEDAEVTDPGDPGPGPSESPTVPDGTFQPGGRRKRKLRR